MEGLTEHAPTLPSEGYPNCTLWQATLVLGLTLTESAVLGPSALDSSAPAIAGASSVLIVGADASSGLYWGEIPSTPSEYSITTGSALAFRFSTGHNVWLMPSEVAYAACDFNAARELASLVYGGGQGAWPNLYTAVALAEGELLFACEAALGSHCGRGQKIRVTVSPPSPPVAPASNPCFGRDMFACRILDPLLHPAIAYRRCFESSIDRGIAPVGAEKVPMTLLRAGDTVLRTAAAATRVLVNQHVVSEERSSLLSIRHTSGGSPGALTVTPDHFIFLDGVAAPASLASPGARLGANASVTAIGTSVGGFVNPITASGTILAASAASLPVAASTYGGWIAPIMHEQWLVPLPCSLCNLVSYLLPVSAQAYHDAVFEPLLPRGAFPLLRSLAQSTPRALRPIVFVAADAAIVASFLLWAFASVAGLLALTGALFATGIAGKGRW